MTGCMTFVYCTSASQCFLHFLSCFRSCRLRRFVLFTTRRLLSGYTRCLLVLVLCCRLLMTVRLLLLRLLLLLWLLLRCVGLLLLAC